MPERQRMTTRLKALFQRPALFVLAGGINPIDQNVVHSETTPLASLVIVPEPGAMTLLLVAGALVALHRSI